MYQCPDCYELHDTEEEAEDCCERQVTNSSSECPVCGERYNEHRDAADCCLWKDLDALTRWAIADAVEAGSDWSTELGIHGFR